MTDRRFEDDLTRLLSAKASWRAPANLRVRVASVPEEIGPSGRLRGLVASVPRVARFAAVAFVMVLVAGSVWLRYETGSPGSGGTPLTIQTEAAPTPLPSGAVWVCTLPLSTCRFELSGQDQSWW